MGLFNRSKGGDDAEETKKEKGAWRRPANTAFKQQRLKAWQPILTPKTVLPTLFIVGILFAPIGGLLIWGSSMVSEFSFDYTECENQAASNPPAFAQIPSSKYQYKLRSQDSKLSINPPQWAFIDNSANDTAKPQDKKQCIIEFHVPAEIEPTLFQYYKLTNFFQNHRRYVKSLNSDQLKGKAVSNTTLDDGDCKPLATINGKAIYPCGLIANSIFNDTFSELKLQNPPEGSPDTYTFSDKGIAWPGEAKKYTSDPAGPGGYALEDIVPPPNWALQYGTSYNDSNRPPDLRNNERFQNWMRTAGLPTFTKLYGKNTDTKLLSGTYQITIGLNYPVTSYKGTKSVVFSTVSWIGGKNAFLGWAYVGAASLFVLLAIAGTARHLIKPRRLGDMSLLSWNR